MGYYDIVLYKCTCLWSRLSKLNSPFSRRQNAENPLDAGAHRQLSFLWAGTKREETFKSMFTWGKRMQESKLKR